MRSFVGGKEGHGNVGKVGWKIHAREGIRDVTVDTHIQISKDTRPAGRCTQVGLSVLVLLAGYEKVKVGLERSLYDPG